MKSSRPVSWVRRANRLLVMIIFSEILIMVIYRSAALNASAIMNCMLETGADVKIKVIIEKTKVLTIID